MYGSLFNRILFPVRNTNEMSMSVLPEHWSEPDSTPGLLYETVWLLLTIAVSSALFVWEPGWIEIEPTPLRIVGSLVIGGSLNVGAASFYYSSRVRTFWSNPTRRFIVLFVIAMGWQIGLWLAPTWTLLSMLSACVLGLPARLYIYIRARS